MAEIVWRARAVRHLNAIDDYLRQRNPSAATKYMSGLYDSCLVLKDFPETGRRYDDRYRALVFRNHLVFYRFDRSRNQISISAIFDGRRDIRSILQILK